MLFKSTNNIEIESIRAFCSAFAQTTHWSKIEPHIYQAEQDYLIPYLSPAQYAIIEPLYQAGTATGKNAELIKKAQYALAYFTAFLFSKTNAVTLANTGNQENVPQNSNAARQWTTRDQQEVFLNTAYSNLDAMLAYLENNKSDFTAWAASDSFTQSHGDFINTTADLNKIVNIGNSMQVFLNVKRFIKHTSLMYIEPVLGSELYEDLLQGIASGNTPNEEASKLLAKIREPLAYLVLFEALPLLPVQLTNVGPRVININDSIVTNMLATKEQVADYAAKMLQLGNMHLARLKDFLYKNVADYPLYTPPTDMDEATQYQPLISENKKVIGF